MNAAPIPLLAAALLAAALLSVLKLSAAGINRLRLELDRRQNPLFDAVTALYLRHPEQYLASALLLGASSLAACAFAVSALALEAAAASGRPFVGSLAVQLPVALVLYIGLAVRLPGMLARRAPNGCYRVLSLLFFPFYLLLSPVAWPLSRAMRWLGRLGGRDGLSATVGRERFDREELESLLDANKSGRRNGEEGDTEIKLFRNALDFADLHVRDCMVPRVDIEAVEEHASIAELTQRFVETMYSRIFVWRGSIDHIIGYVNAKRLFTRPASVAEALRPVATVPGSMSLQAALQHFIRRRSNVAVVIDEFGDTAGIISLEDVLEQIFGDIEDEHDTPDLTEQRLGENSYLFSCRLPVRHLNERYGLGIEERHEYDTLAGFIIYRCGGLPAAGERLRFDALEVEIVRTTRSRIELARVRRL